jgi:hypothetical protein
MPVPNLEYNQMSRLFDKRHDDCADTAPRSSRILSAKPAGTSDVRAAVEPGHWTVSLAVDDGTVLAFRIADPTGNGAERRCTRAEAEAALAVMKDHHPISVDGVDEVALDALQRLTSSLAAQVATVWRQKNLGYPVATTITAVAQRLLLARAVHAIKS